MTVLNTVPFELLDQPLFFGNTQGIARYDREKYPIFSKLRKLQKSLFWEPEEINLQKDSIDFKSLQPHEKHIFTKNIAYQILLDSIQERAPLHAFLPWVSHPELESCIITWCFFEQIHAESYQWILRNLFPDPAVIFDSILTDSAIVERAQSIIKYYDEFISYSDKVKVYGYTKDLTLFELKQRLYLALISVYALESIRFYVSFACSFAFGKLGKMTGNASIIKLIAKDEAQHVAISLNILKTLKQSEDADFKKIIAENEKIVYSIFDEVVQQEKDWATYLFKDGAIVGLNQGILCDYVEYTANKRLKGLGLKSQYSITNDPLSWMSAYINGDEVQVAPQEQEITEYRVNIITNDLGDSEIVDF
jgi:ribonucleoside-diphosphate reductase beta chain